jgi:hypothetical protein
MCACDWLHDIRQIPCRQDVRADLEQLRKRLKLCSLWQLPVNRKLHNMRQLHVSLRILDQQVTDEQMTQATQHVSAAQ